MHEVGMLTRAIAEAVTTAERAGARRIERLTFAIVPGGHVSAETVQTLVPVLAAGTLADGAAVAVERLAGSYVCVTCDRTYASANGSTVCPSCGRPGLPEPAMPELALVGIDVAE